ncbi:MAG: YHS domain-containing protein [Actinomycetota bacterium]|nr:YHS domain-containing protein [Actinomycetota bacterium]
MQTFLFCRSRRCLMAIDPARRAGVLTHHGREYTFCSLHCVAAFSNHPDRYTTTVPL